MPLPVTLHQRGHCLRSGDLPPAAPALMEDRAAVREPLSLRGRHQLRFKFWGRLRATLRCSALENPGVTQHLHRPMQCFRPFDGSRNASQRYSLSHYMRRVDRQGSRTEFQRSPAPANIAVRGGQPRRELGTEGTEHKGVGHTERLENHALFLGDGNLRNRVLQKTLIT